MEHGVNYKSDSFYLLYRLEQEKIFEKIHPSVAPMPNYKAKIRNYLITRKQSAMESRHFGQKRFSLGLILWQSFSQIGDFHLETLPREHDSNILLFG